MISAYDSHTNNGKTLLYDGTCKVCLSFVTKFERILAPDSGVKFTPFGMVVRTYRFKYVD